MVVSNRNIKRYRDGIIKPAFYIRSTFPTAMPAGLVKVAPQNSSPVLLKLSLLGLGSSGCHIFCKCLGGSLYCPWGCWLLPFPFLCLFLMYVILFKGSFYVRVMIFYLFLFLFYFLKLKCQTNPTKKLLKFTQCVAQHHCLRSIFLQHLSFLWCVCC